MRKSRRAYPFLIGAFLLAWFTMPVLQAEAQVVRVAGSSSMATMVDAWAQSFMAAQPGIKVIVRGGGTGTGFKAFFQKRAEIVMASCTASEDDRTKAARLGIQLTQSEVGREAVAVIVHPMIGVEALTVEQLRRIFAGEYRIWSQVGGPSTPMAPTSLEYRVSGIAVWFRANILRKGSFGPDAQFRPRPELVVRRVANEPGAIGYLGYSLLVGLLKRYQDYPVTVIRMRADEQSPAFDPPAKPVAHSMYPMVRPLFLYWDGRSPSGAVTQFIEFCAGRATR